MDQTQVNKTAWNAGRYDAWHAAYGTPADAAARIVADPNHVLRRLQNHLPELSGANICNVQGSHGRVAVALALLGARVTVVDFAQDNRRYALELAAAANIDITYTLSDVMQITDFYPPDAFECLVLEMGILHYHRDLVEFFRTLRGVCVHGATLVLNEFHPVQRKLYWADGPADYFSPKLVEAEVPNPILNGPSLGICQYRFWTMAEIVTACIQAGFDIKRLEEHADTSVPALPGSFTLLAQAC